MEELIIDNEFKSYVRPLTDEEYEKLKESILAEGIRDPLVVWKNVLLDGHHRFKLAQEHGLEYKTVEVDLPDIWAAKDWIIKNQLGRRNLTEQEASYYRGKLYESRKRQGERTDLTSAQNVLKFNTAEEIGKEYGVSHMTVKRDAEFSAAVDKVATEVGEEAKRAILSGKANIPKFKVEKLIEVKQEVPEYIEPILKGEISLSKAIQESKKRLIEQVQEERRNTKEITRATIYHDDCYNFLNRFESKSVDLLITDPPYSTDVKDLPEFLDKWLYDALDKVKDTGRVFICIGAYPIEIYTYLKYLLKTDWIVDNPLVWTYRNTLGQTPKMKYNLNYQLIIHLYKETSNPLDNRITNEMFSVQDINAPDGRLGDRFYKWQKPDLLAERLINHTTKGGDIIIDPFAGCGTFILKASELNRIAYGCDIDIEAINIAKKRGCYVV